MTNVNGVNPAAAPKAVAPVSPVVNANQAVPPANVSDVVEISNVAKLAAKVQEIPDVRTELVAKIREEIAAGAYETPERIDGAVNKLMEELFGDQ
jgi:negative regulator of flagellin synthesis FlgM